MIQLDSVTFNYPSGPAIFSNFTWEVKRGEAWAVIGSSGCGKSTLLYLLAGLRFPASGRVLVEGKSLTRPRPYTGLIIQEYGLLPWATVRQNAALGQHIRQFYGPDGTHAPLKLPPAADVEEWLERLGLQGVANQYPSKISGGQRQRTAIARTLSLHPDLLLMDEPFSSVDAPTREDLQTLPMELCREKQITLVIVTHAIEEAAVLGKKILLLEGPPNLQPVVIVNEGAEQPQYRVSSQYQAVCRELRERMQTV